MTERKKKILSLLVSTSLMLGTTGCSEIDIERNIDSNKVATYEGNINLDSMNYLYVIEIKDLNENKELYLTHCKGLEKLTGGYKYKILGTSIILAESDNMNAYTSELGEVINVIPFKQFWATYLNEVRKSNEITNYYSAQEIFDIFELVKTNYDELIKNDKVKKLELKK